MWHVQNVLKHKVTFSSQFCHYVMKSERHEDASCKEWVIKLIVVSHCHENVTRMWWSVLSTCFLAPHIWKFPPCKKAMRSFTIIINNVPWVLSFCARKALVLYVTKFCEIFGIFHEISAEGWHIFRGEAEENMKPEDIFFEAKPRKILKLS